MERTQLTEMRQRASAKVGRVRGGGDRVKLWATRERHNFNLIFISGQRCITKPKLRWQNGQVCHCRLKLPLCEKSVADPSGDVKVFIASFPQCPTLVSSIQHP